MKRKPSSVTASASRFAEVAAKTGGVFVFATRDANLPHLEEASAEIAKYQFVGHRCNVCASVFDAVKAKGLQTHCVTCGTDEVEVLAETKPTIPQDKDLSYLTCAGCGTLSVVQPALASTLEAVHCSVCGHGIKTVAELGDDIVDEDVETLDVDDMEMLDLDEPELSETTQGELPNDSGAEPTSLTEDPKAPGAQAPIVPAQANADEMPNNDYSGDLEVDLLDLEDEQPAALAFVHLGDTINAAVNGKIVASLTAETAGENAEIMQSEAFRNAVAHTVKSHGLKKALAGYGFKSVKVKVPLTKAVMAKVAEAVTAQTASLAKSGTEYAKDFQQAVDIAAAGFAGNYWRNLADPLKAAWMTELTTAGIRNPQKVVDRVFASHSIASLRMILEKARELASTPVEARNSLSSAIDLVKYLPTPSKAELAEADEEDEDEDEDDEDGDGEKASLSTVATPVSSTTASTETRLYKSPELDRILGSKSLFN